MASPFELLWVFGRLSLVSYGGGPSMIPLVQAEVERRGWMTAEQFVDGLGVGYALPGPIATKMAAWVGWHAGGGLGATAALAGVTLPPVALMGVVVTLLVAWKDHPRVHGMLAGVRPVVLSLLVVMTWELVPKSVTGGATGLLAAAAAGLLLATSVHPAWIVLGGACAGALFLAPAP